MKRVFIFLLFLFLKVFLVQGLVYGANVNCPDCGVSRQVSVGIPFDFSSYVATSQLFESHGSARPLDVSIPGAFVAPQWYDSILKRDVSTLDPSFHSPYWNLTAGPSLYSDWRRIAPPWAYYGLFDSSNCDPRIAK